MKLLFVDELEVVDVDVESESRFKAGEAPLIYLRPLSVLSPSGNPACNAPACNAPACNFVSAGPETRKQRCTFCKETLPDRINASQHSPTRRINP
jgi:hypothetical protein